ncbi:MAG TPA: hypothetical protein VF517_18420 [Thermoleophilaceae bacterium]|jgi:hypothetical protein
MKGPEEMDLGRGKTSAYAYPPARQEIEPKTESPTLPLPPPRDREALSALIEAVASTPNGRRDDVRRMIGEWGERSAVADVLHQELHSLPTSDVGRHGLLLSIIGELAEPSSVDALERFLWMSKQEIYGPSPEPADGDGCGFEPVGILEARAAEMLAWVLKTDQEDRVMKIVLDHPLGAVRAAAIDAYLFNRDDDPDAAAELAKRVRSADAWAVGLPRRFDGMYAEDFERLAAEHAAQHGHPPEMPHRNERGHGVH